MVLNTYKLRLPTGVKRRNGGYIMKNMNMKKRYWTMNLQVFAGDGGDDDPGDEGRR